MLYWKSFVDKWLYRTIDSCLLMIFYIPKRTNTRQKESFKVTDLVMLVQGGECRYSTPIPFL